MTTAEVPEPSTLLFCGATFHGFAVCAFCLWGTGIHAQSQPYFQQQVDYRVDVRLDDRTNDLFATEAFDYRNNSPRAIDTLWIHLWPNAYRDANSALCEQMDAQNDFGLHFAERDQRGWIDSLDFHSGDARLAWGFDARHTDIAWIRLPAPLSSGSTITISTPFHVRVPSARFSRLGHLGDAFYITQWYPKPAVFDALGWHAMPYLTQGEFYSEFGSFDVSITLPANYVVGATGELQDASEVAWMDSLADLPPTFMLSTGGDAFPPSSTRMKTLRFKQDRVHDFAWFADKRFQVKQGSVTLPRSGRTVRTCVLVTPHNAAMWSDAVTYVNESVRLYSEWVGDYAYDRCTAIDGGSAAGGGMEYPMITIINDSSDPFDLDVVIAHEVGHNWFYGMLGSNERQHAWMDEGINSFYEQRYVQARYPGKRLNDVQGVPLGFLTGGKGVGFRQQNEIQYRYNARRALDSPIDAPGQEFSFLDYGTTLYSKSALVFDHLFAYLGDPVFDASMQAYFDQWRFKHPYPADMRSIFEKRTAKDLDWCFSELIGTADKIDVKAVKFRNGELRTRSNSRVPMPFGVTRFAGDRAIDTTWALIPRGRTSVPISTEGADHVRIDAGERSIDIDRRNNEVRSHGLLRRTRLPEVRFLAGLEREDRRSVFWAPIIGRNAHDGWMPGVALYNTLLPDQRFEWVVAPMFGLNSERVAGGARFMWNHDRLRSDLLRNMHIGVSGFRASLENIDRIERWYERVVPSVQFDLRSRPNATFTDLRLRSVMLWQHAQGPFFNGREDVPIDQRTEDIFQEVRLRSVHANGMHPFNAQLIGLHHEAFDRLSIEANWSAIYDVRKHRISFRAFGGTFLRKNAALLTREMGWRMHWSESDLLYDHLFLDRQDPAHLTGQQIIKDQGGFKTPTAIGTSDTWIAALNMEVDLPFRLPLAMFASYGVSPFTTITQNGRTTDRKGQWEAGIGLRIVRDVVEVWVPLAFSKDIADEHTLRDLDFTERIRFVFALERMDPTQALRKLPH